MKLQTLEIPDWIDTGKAGDAFYYPDHGLIQQKAVEFGKQHDIKPANNDKLRIIHVGIDWQRDFSHPEGSLFVAGRSGTGAIDAARRSAEWRWKYFPMITEMVLTMDTHLPLQVFFPTMHVRADGEPVVPHTIISAEEYAKGVYLANSEAAKELGTTQSVMTKQWQYYTKMLEEIDPKTGKPKHQLYLWPFHCMLGSWGHTLVGVIDEVRFLHALVRDASNIPEIKGGSPWVENYSVFQPEMLEFFNGEAIPNVQKNTTLIARLLSATIVIFDGLADSHCLRESMYDFSKDLDPELAKKIYIKKDCSASVVTPMVDFTEDAETAYADWADQGMNIVESTTPFEHWPGVADALQLQ
jgi:nicotinamidase-related amidase